MNPYELLGVLPLMLSLGISAVVGIYCLRRQTVPGARAYGWLALSQALWAAAAILNLSGPSLNEKIFWNNIERLALFSIPYTYPIFTAQFIGFGHSILRRLRLLLGIVPLGMALLLLTDPYTHLYYSNPRMVAGDPFATLQYGLTPLMQTFGLYGLLVVLGTFIVLSAHFIRPNRLYRSQVLAIIVASLIPTTTTILTLVHLTETDLTPLTFTIRNLIVIWALFRYRLFDITPIARDAIMDNIPDPVGVLDILDRVVDIDPAAATLIGIPASQAIGQPARVVFSAWPKLLAEFAHVTQAKTQIAARISGGTRYFNLSISPVYDRGHHLIGRVFVSREITARIRLEHRLQRLNNSLEDRVRERTTELAEAYDTTLQGWAKALELRDKEMQGHSQRVTSLTLQIARALDIAEEELVHMWRGALLHDIGKMAIPDQILRKGTDLTKAEKEIVSRHPQIAYELLAPIPYLAKALDIPYCHHERWDGCGYPRGLKGDQIPLSARIFIVADVWDALGSDQLYRGAWPKDKTIQYMKEQSGAIFDPHILDRFLELLEQGQIG